LRLAPQNRNFTSIFDLRRPFRAKGFRLAPQNRNFTSIFDLRRPFRAKGLRLAPQNRNFQLVFQRVFSPKQGIFLTHKTFKFDTQIPSNRHHFLRIWNQSGTSREPVGKIRAPPQKASKMLKKACFCRVFSVFWSIFGFFRVVHGFSRLVPDWFPTGSKFVKSGAEICRSWCQILAVNLPNLRKNQNLENV